MTFSSYFKLSSYLLVLCGFSALVITRFFTLFAFVFLLIVMYSWNREKIGFKIKLPKWFWNALTLAYFFYASYDVFFGSGDLIGQGINFTVYLQVYKLLNLKSNRDYFHMYILSFVNLLSASILTESIVFAVPFLIYIVLATWTFTLYNLKVQYEESLGKKNENRTEFYSSRKIITRKFLLATSLLSLVLIVFTSVIFFFFPRMSLGFFYKKVGNRKSMAGFSEEIDLGSIGSIMQNSTVVMRVETPNGSVTPAELERIYWRGTAFDSYDGKKWGRTSKEKEKRLIDVLTGAVKLAEYKPGAKVFVQRIFLEPLETKIVFAADEMKGIKWEKLKIERFLRKEIGVEKDIYGTSYILSSLSADQKYYAFSDLDAKTVYAPSNEEPVYPVRASYFEVPYNDDRIAGLVSDITRDITVDYEKAKAIERYLKGNYSYSDIDLNFEADQRPLEGFLFDLGRGHCELFSTAMVMMLRYAGIPSRNVVGFRGGNINELGNYIVVRQSDAHSWVEAYISGNGWMRFDPTPGAAEGFQLPSRSFGVLAKYFDYLKLRWYKYVIDYDLRAQARYARMFFAGARKFFTTASAVKQQEEEIKEKIRYGSGRYRKIFLMSLASIIVAFVLFMLIRVFLRRGSRSKKLQAGQVDFYMRMLKILRKKGIHKQVSQTPKEFSKKVLTKRGKKYGFIEDITEDYYSLRFGGNAVSKQRAKILDENLRRLKEL